MYPDGASSSWMKTLMLLTGSPVSQMGIQWSTSGGLCTIIYRGPVQTASLLLMWGVVGSLPDVGSASLRAGRTGRKSRLTRSEEPCDGCWQRPLQEHVANVFLLKFELEWMYWIILLVHRFGENVKNKVFKGFPR